MNKWKDVPTHFMMERQQKMPINSKFIKKLHIIPTRIVKGLGGGVVVDKSIFSFIWKNKCLEELLKYEQKVNC